MKTKSLDYYVYSCTSHTTLREVLSDFCKDISVVDLNKPTQQKLVSQTFVVKSNGELLLDIQEYCDMYYKQNGECKSPCLLVDMVGV